ncbi:DUF397 domain-containing protein [Kitasatospora sp. NPDC089913]|uniref:DUF397 domain-containing protein n=1 Tax=Kitasatospora sp. NPDC089913 TaxID=3364080 RepID=UPI0038009DA3
MSSLNWQKSTYSSQAANCIQVAAMPDGAIRIRESDEPAAILATTQARLRALLLGAKAGKFDHLAQ